jgi:hypothetical protein
MNLNEIIFQILVGGLLGIIGQGLRVIVGIKKMKDVQSQNKQNNSTIPGGDFDSKRLWLSIFIGFIAGALGGLFAVDLKEPLKDKTVLATLIAIGYAGVDFIEGFMTKLGNGK